MKIHKNQNCILGAIILLTMLLSLLFPTSSVSADDTTPPVEPSEAVDAPLDEETPSEEEVSAEIETPEAEEPIEKEPVVEKTATEEPAIEDAATEVPAIEDSSLEGRTQAEAEPVLTQVPDGTDVIILDEEGEVVPLATQEAAEAIATSDPMWCPEGFLPGSAGCSAIYTSMTDLLAALSGAGQPTQNGTIWIEATYDSSVAEPGGTTSITINGNNF